MSRGRGRGSDRQRETGLFSTHLPGSSVIFQFGGKKAQLDFVHTVANPNGGNNARFSFSPPCNSQGDTGRTQLFRPNFARALFANMYFVARPARKRTLSHFSALSVKPSPQWTYPLGETNPAKTRRCAFACGGGGGHTPDPMPGRERERGPEIDLHTVQRTMESTASCEESRKHACGHACSSNFEPKPDRRDSSTLEGEGSVA